MVSGPGKLGSSINTRRPGGATGQHMRVGCGVRQRTAGCSRSLVLSSYTPFGKRLATALTITPRDARTGELLASIQKRSARKDGRIIIGYRVEKYGEDAPSCHNNRARIWRKNHRAPAQDRVRRDRCELYTRLTKSSVNRPSHPYTSLFLVLPFH